MVTLPNVNYSSNDSINDSINDLGLSILKKIKEKPGINAPQLTKELGSVDSSITLFRVKNELRRNLNSYVEHRGPNKNGGYFLRGK